MTHEDIDTVVAWMDSWDQLKGTAIPIRFKEDFTKNECKGAIKPPLGVVPEWVWKQQRQQELLRAITQYTQAGLKPLPQWFEEYIKL